MPKDYWIFDENKKCLISERNNKVYKIGDKVKIMVIEANKQLRKIAFALLNEEENQETIENIEE